MRLKSDSSEPLKKLVLLIVFVLVENQVHCKIWSSLRQSLFFRPRFGKQSGCPTKRAADGGESARFTDIFLALSFSTSQATTTPTLVRR